MDKLLSRAPSQLLCHLNTWATTYDEESEEWVAANAPYLHELSLGWLGDRGSVSIDLALTENQVRELLAGQLDSAVELSPEGQQRAVLHDESGLRAVPLELSAVHLTSTAPLEFESHLQGNGIDLRLQPRLEHLCVNALDSDSAAKLLASFRLPHSELEGEEDDEDGTYALTAHFPEPQEREEETPGDTSSIVIECFQNLDVSLTVLTEHWCAQEQAWLYGQAPRLSLGLEITVDESSGEDGALAPSLHLDFDSEVPAWYQLVGEVYDESNVALEAWYGNDAPELTDNRFEFLPDRRFLWTARCGSRPFRFGGQFPEPTISVSLKDTEDLERILQAAWPAQAKIGVEVLEVKAVDYGPSMPEERRRWQRLTLRPRC